MIFGGRAMDDEAMERSIARSTATSQAKGRKGRTSKHEPKLPVTSWPAAAAAPARYVRKTQSPRSDYLVQEKPRPDYAAGGGGAGGAAMQQHQHHHFSAGTGLARGRVLGGRATYRRGRAARRSCGAGGCTGVLCS